jgi:hypothetical protein
MEVYAMGFFKKLFFKSKGEPAVETPKTYLENDNRGMRYETQQQSISYWMGERLQRTVKDPFVYYIFKNETDARNALLDLPFIHEANDTGKLICDEVFNYGYYNTSNDGIPTGECDAFVTGPELTHELWEKLHQSFKNHSGIKKSDLEPGKSVKIINGKNGNAKRVTFDRENKVQGYTYLTYKAQNKADALAFLAGHNITQPNYYMIVDTPDGSFGKDRQGYFKE